jgi:peptide/nickel transport system permease protein
VIRLIAHRLLLSVPLLFVVTVLSFALEQIVPGDAAQDIAGPRATPAELEQIRIQLGLTRPFWSQYGHWLGNALHGNLGTSLFTGQPVTADLDSRLPVTLSLMAGVLIVCTVVGLALGTVSAWHEGALGKAIDALSMAGLGLPAYWLSLVLIAIFAVGLRILPATGYTYFTSSPRLWALDLVLPVIALSLGAVTAMAKQTRDSMRTVLGQPFIRGLRAAGVPERSVIWKHALRNASIPLVTVLGLVAVATLSASVFVEAAFVLPGLGSLAVSAAQEHDLPVVEGIALYFTAATIIINLLVDITYGWLNPRIRVT